MELNNERSNQLTFALDIGTRTIIAVVGEYDENEIFHVRMCRKVEHKKRNMHDGQIHDIEEVAKTVQRLLNDLERDVGESFDRVSIAAAGRALRTVKSSYEVSLGGRTEINHNHVDKLELNAVQRAQEEINNAEQGTGVHYFNVGYTVSGYYMDEEKIDSLVGHKAERIGVDIVATFLPRGVVESLYTVISKVGLEVGSMTLEPIAAMNVAIKKDLRLLNLALVDIGAGTSDIAVTRDGEIIAYGMTQTAGDEITDDLSRQFLLDFQMAERLKVSLNKQEEHVFSDILGKEYRMTTSQILDCIDPVVEGIASEIASKILEYNGKSPSAVFLIGGSSQLPGINQKISEKLGLPKERVVVRDLTALDFIKGLEQTTPDFVTPIGIAMEGFHDKYRSFISVSFMGKDVRLFNMDRVYVSDVLLLTGYDMRNLMPKTSESFVFYLNGKKRYLGVGGDGPKILINDIEGNIKSELHDGDIIEVRDTSEQEVGLKLGEIVDFEKEVDVEGTRVRLLRSVYLNGLPAAPDMTIHPQDEVITEEFQSFEQIEKELLGGPVSSSKEVKQEEQKQSSGQKKSELGKNSPMKKGKERKSIHLFVNGNEKDYTHEKEEFTFIDLFEYVDIDLSKVHGHLILSVNGQTADFNQKLNSGDKIEIRWE